MLALEHIYKGPRLRPVLFTLLHCIITDDHNCMSCQNVYQLGSQREFYETGNSGNKLLLNIVKPLSYIHTCCQRSSSEGCDEK